MKSFRWTTRTERAALLLAEDQLTDEQIAQKVHVAPSSLWKWKRHPDFQARVQEHVAAQREALRAEGIANRQNRVDALNDRHRRMHQVIEERAGEHSMQMVPGGGTGLLVRQTKQIGGGDHARVIEEYAVDTGLLRELREHEKQAAQELGQWTEKHDVTSAGERLSFTFDFARMTPRESATDEPA